MREYELIMSRFDFHVTAATCECAAAPPPGLWGALCFGDGARAVCAELSRQAPERLWLSAFTVSCGPQAGTPAPPSRAVAPASPPVGAPAPPVADLWIAEDEFLACARRPGQEWWPLPESVRLVHLNLLPGSRCVAALTQVARMFPNVRFMIDPFAHGPRPGWQAQVRAAERANIWLTTLGLAPGPACRWMDARESAQALHFVAGEVGAGKLLLATGRSLREWPAEPAEEWLHSLGTLDRAQGELVLSGNARELLRRGD